MKKRILVLVCICILSLLFSLSFFYLSSPVYAVCDLKDYSSPEEYQKAIDECQIEIDSRMEAHNKNKDDLDRLEKNIKNIQKVIDSAVSQIDNLEKEIFAREVELEYQKEILAARVRSFYKKSRQYSPLLIFLASSSANDLFRELSYRQTATQQDKKIIIDVSQDLITLKNDKEKLEKNKNVLASAQTKLDQQAQSLKVEIGKVETYFTEISGKIAQLTSKQEELLGQKLASLNLPSSLGAGPLYCVDDRKIDPGFSPAFAFYTFGIPHRVGMNQYGAYGRANAGQSYDQILHAYYNFDGYRDGVSATIKVNNGNGINQGSVIWTGGLEDYMKRIYEVPSSWPMESLKAQAIAVRSYVLAVTNNGNNSICANQYCQVFKTDPKGGDWDKAASETAGKVMISGGEIITAWYASTAGGYTFTNSDVWGGSQRSWTKRFQDTSGDVSGFSDLFNNAYDKDSPCFYAAQGWRSEYGKSAWLKPNEVADIVNVLLLAKTDSSTQKHLPQVDKPNPDGVETWEADRVKQELRDRGITPYNNISNISVDWDKGLGRTTTLTISGDAGTKNFDGPEFKNFFNLRAPANIQIVGPLFNIEKK